MDGSLVIISIIDLLTMNRGVAPVPGAESDAATRIFSMLRVFRLLRTLRPLRGKAETTDQPFAVPSCPSACSDQPRTRSEIGGANIDVLVATHRSHCRYLLYILHYFRHSRCTGTQTVGSRKTQYPISVPSSCSKGNSTTARVLSLAM